MQWSKVNCELQCESFEVNFTTTLDLETIFCDISSALTVVRRIHNTKDTNNNYLNLQCYLPTFEILLILKFGSQEEEL